MNGAESLTVMLRSCDSVIKQEAGQDAAFICLLAPPSPTNLLIHVCFVVTSWQFSVCEGKTVLQLDSGLVGHRPMTENRSSWHCLTETVQSFPRPNSQFLLYLIHDQWRLFIVKKCPQKDISPGFAATWEWVTWAAVQAEKPSLPFSSPLFRGNPEVFPSQLKRAAGSLYSSLSTTQEQETKCPDGRHKVCSEQSWTGQFRVEYGHQQSRKNPWPKSMFLAGVSGESTVNRLMIEPVTFLL